ncbi:ATP-binding protein [Pseudoalteromonas sp. Angola-30]|uniref:hybrid sensor histidine kinase/response regulator n=1 Tax=Pseudoalteromonas sp. Angola-30 TaxID=3025341 RepID=UPI00235A1CAC|nr:response regulator [Pseudoalteromonas sp. Angola-30]MDC9527254.1 ATP-binding protein [Pseudoalteromonas sp. Angola-30]
MITRSIKSKIIIALCVLITLLILQSYLFNYSQKSLFELQNAQHKALLQSESVTRLENDVISLQSQAIAYLDHANSNTIEKFNMHLNAAKRDLDTLSTYLNEYDENYQNNIKRLNEYLNNYQDTFNRVVVNRTKREQLYITQFKQPIEALKAQLNELEKNTQTSKQSVIVNILLTISNIEQATTNYLHKPNYDEAQNVQDNLAHLNTLLASIETANVNLLNNTDELEQAYSQLVILTRSYTFSINVVLTGIENELLYLAEKIRDVEKQKLTQTEQQLRDHVLKSTEMANLFAALITVIIIVITFFIFNSVIKPIAKLTKLLNDMSNEKQVTLNGNTHHQSEINSVITAANALYLKNKQTKALLAQTQALNTKMELMNKELTVAMTQAKNANQAKGDFVANMSHELRTPMNGILGMLQLLQSSALPAKQKHYADKAFSSAQNLLQILNNVLDFSKLESDKVKLESIPFTLHTVVSNVKNLFSVNAKQKGLRLNFVLHVDAGLELLGDPLYLSQIINNCVGNALKFTERGEITLSIEATTQDKQNIQLRFGIKDTGIGMTPEQTESIFDSFYQGDSSTTRKYGGTGLGLTICKQLTKLLGGEIQVRSTPHVGSEFYFTLPFKMTNQETLKKHALLISPDKKQINSLTKLLSNADITTEVTQEPLRAIAKISQPNNPFSIVLMALLQAELKDNFILQQLYLQKQRNKHKLLLILLISDQEQPQAVPDSEHIDIITIGNSHPESQLMRLLLADSTNLPTSDSYPQYTGYTALVVDDNPINQEIIEALLSKMNMTVVLANNGKEALECVDKHEVDIIFMDIQMPVMDGLEATRILRQRGYITPIIAITAAAFSNDKKAAIRAGMDDYLVKPLLFGALYETIEKHIKKTHTLSTLNLALAIDNLDGNSELINTVFTKFIDDYSNFTDIAATSLSNNEFKSLSMAMHSLKGLAGTLGLELLEQCAKKAEMALANKADVDLTEFNEQLTLTLYAVRQFLVTHSISQVPAGAEHSEQKSTLIDNIYNLALSARPVPSQLIREIERKQFPRSHPLFELKEAIDNFNYALVIKLINDYRNNYKN